MLRCWNRSRKRILGRSARFFGSGPVRLILLLFILILAVPALYNAALPPHDWDGFMYHLLLPAGWLQQGSLAVFPAPPQLQLDKWVHFTANTELASVWWMAASGGDGGVYFSLWFFVLPGLLALCGILRILGTGNRRAVWVLPLAVSVPVALCQLNSSYADFSIAALFFLVIYLGLRAFQSGSRLCLTGSAVAGAVLLGGKASGPLFFLLAWFGVLAAALFLNRSGWKQFLRSVFVKSLIFAFSGLLLGSFFFLRNWAVRGNPLYPYQVRVAGKVLFPGIDPVRQTASREQKDRAGFLKRTAMDRYRQYRYNYYAHPYAGHGPLPVAAGLPAMGFLLLFFVVKQRWRMLGVLLSVAAAVLLIVLAMPTLFPALHSDCRSFFDPLRGAGRSCCRSVSSCVAADIGCRSRIRGAGFRSDELPCKTVYTAVPGFRETALRGGFSLFRAAVPGSGQDFERQACYGSLFRAAGSLPALWQAAAAAGRASAAKGL